MKQTPEEVAAVMARLKVLDAQEDARRARAKENNRKMRAKVQAVRAEKAQRRKLRNKAKMLGMTVQQYRKRRAEEEARLNRPKATLSAAYLERLNSTEWRVFRLSVIAQRGHACECCQETRVRLDLHHRTYARLGVERPEDVVLLCRRCHDAHHGVVVGKARRPKRPNGVG